MLGSKFVNLDSGVDFQPNKLESFHTQELEANVVHRILRISHSS